MLFEDQLAALEADSRKSGTQGDDLDFALARRRPQRRARAGHHHRRRLPLLRDRPAQVHRRRHARPRAIYPQHGDRRLDRRPRHHPDRRAQGRAYPDEAPQPPRPPARHPPRRARGQQDGPGRLRSRAVRRDRRRLSRPSPTRSGSAPSSPSRIAALSGDNIAARSPAMPWYEGPSLLEHLETVPIAAARPESGAFHMAVQWVNRPDSRFPRLCRPDRRRHRPAGRRDRHPAVGTALARSSGSSRSTATSSGRSKASRSPSPWPTRSTARAAR